jgi:hypothetical protein
MLKNRREMKERATKRKKSKNTKNGKRHLTKKRPVIS